MVDLKNKIYLIDFGYATAPNVKLPGQTGTPLFMSQAIQSQGTIFIIIFFFNLYYY